MFEIVQKMSVSPLLPLHEIQMHHHALFLLTSPQADLLVVSPTFLKSSGTFPVPNVQSSLVMFRRL